MWDKTFAAVKSAFFHFLLSHILGYDGSHSSPERKARDFIAQSRYERSTGPDRKVELRTLRTEDSCASSREKSICAILLANVREGVLSTHTSISRKAG